MHEQRSRLHRTFAELRRRHVVRVTGAYAILAWGTLQVLDIILPALQVPDWVLTLFVVLAVIGLPIVATVTWIYDITPEGVVRTDRVDDGTVEQIHWNWRWLDYAIIVLLAAILAYVLVRDGGGAPHAPGKSIAVLPFADLSTEGNHRYFCDGMSEALIDSLGRIPELTVASRTSSFAYRDLSMDARTVAGKLDVSTILEGSVRKFGNEVRIDARLVDGRNGYNLWNDSYEGTLDDIFSLQDKIAQAIVNVLEVKLLGSGKLVETATRDQGAYDLYLRGRAKLRETGTLKDLAAAVDFFEQALERDPEFALAMAGLCTARWQEYEITRDREQSERAVAACQDAAANESHTETHVSLGRLYEGTGQLDKANAALEHALEMAPENAEAFAARGLVRVAEGDLQAAEREILRAIELDPEYWRHYSDLGYVHAVMGQLDKAGEQFSRAISLQPGSPIPHYQLGAVLLLQGQNLKAADAFRASIAHGATARAYSNAASNYFYSGALEEAEEMYREAATLNPSDHRWRGNLAFTIALQGGRDHEAREYFERAAELAYKRLEVNPGDHSARSSAAIYLARLGQADAARKELRTLADQEFTDLNVKADQATAYLFLGEPDTAVKYLEQAVLDGYPPQLLKSDPNLQPLRDHPRFRALVDNDAKHPAKIDND